MADICIKCGKAITDEFNRSYHDETKDGVPLFTHMNCNHEEWEKEIKNINT